MLAAMQDRHVMSARRQPLDDLAADEQDAADHENAHAPSYVARMIYPADRSSDSNWRSPLSSAVTASMYRFAQCPASSSEPADTTM
jgi:hypothetical protein